MLSPNNSTEAIQRMHCSEECKSQAGDCVAQHRKSDLTDFYGKRFFIIIICKVLIKKC